MGWLVEDVVTSEVEFYSPIWDDGVPFSCTFKVTGNAERGEFLDASLRCSAAVATLKRAELADREGKIVVRLSRREIAEKCGRLFLTAIEERIADEWAENWRPDRE